MLRASHDLTPCLLPATPGSGFDHHISEYAAAGVLAVSQRAVVDLHSGVSGLRHAGTRDAMGITGMQVM